MKKMVLGGLLLCYLGFATLGFLLVTGRAGLAIKASNYLFFVLCFGIVLKYFSDD